MKYIFDDWEQIIAKLKLHRKTMLLFDYDGTLTPIVDTPELADFAPDMRNLLQKLTLKRNFIVGVISGRALSDIKQKIRLNRMIYAGNHGLEIQGPNFDFVHPLTLEFQSAINIIGQMLDKSLSKIRGAFVEDKGLTLSVHYRLVQDETEEQEVKNIFEKIVGVARSVGIIRTTPGKKVYEVRPAVLWNKGKAVKLILKKHGKGGILSGILPIYIGDDLTDEDAFKVIEGYTGISIYVGGENAGSMAGYYLNNVSEVKEFMRRLVIL